MSLLFETIRVQDGMIMYPEWHDERMQQSSYELWGKKIILPEIYVPAEYSSGIVKCNVIYGPDHFEILFSYYQKRNIRSLRLISCDDLDYHLKYHDRRKLKELFDKRGDCDDILIIKNGLITDTSFSNIIFNYDGRWTTPAKPLLNGTCRQRMISEGFLDEEDISPEDIEKFSGCRIINSMRYHFDDELITNYELRIT